MSSDGSLEENYDSLDDETLDKLIAEEREKIAKLDEENKKLDDENEILRNEVIELCYQKAASTAGNLKCTSCKEQYNETRRYPLAIKCGHSICRKCYSKQVREACHIPSSTAVVQIKCPTCKAAVKVPREVSEEKVVKNYSLMKFVEAVTSNN